VVRGQSGREGPPYGYETGSVVSQEAVFGGSVTVNVVPSFGVATTSIDAPIASTQSRTIDKPRPRPSM
jgi:carbohydrate-binding DOMON domain-containing protein